MYELIDFTSISLGILMSIILNLCINDNTLINYYHEAEIAFIVRLDK